jgi:hypothetical protein
MVSTRESVRHNPERSRASAWGRRAGTSCRRVLEGKFNIGCMLI